MTPRKRKTGREGRGSEVSGEIKKEEGRRRKQRKGKSVTVMVVVPRTGDSKGRGDGMKWQVYFAEFSSKRLQVLEEEEEERDAEVK